MSRSAICGAALLVACTNDESGEPKFGHRDVVFDTTLAGLGDLPVDVLVWTADYDGMEGPPQERGLTVYVGHEEWQGSSGPLGVCYRLGSQFAGALDGLPMTVQSLGSGGTMDGRAVCDLPTLTMDLTEFTGGPSVRLELNDGTRPVLIDIPDVLEMRSIAPLDPTTTAYAPGQEVVLAASPSRDVPLRHPQLVFWLDGTPKDVENFTYENGNLEFDVPQGWGPGEGYVHVVYASIEGEGSPTTCSGATECEVRASAIEAYLEATIR